MVNNKGQTTYTATQRAEKTRGMGDSKEYFFLTDALHTIMATHPNLEVRSIAFAAPVYYPIALVDVTMQERVFEDYEGMEKHILQFVADIGADPELLEVATGLSNIYVRRILAVLETYGHVADGAITALGLESLQSDQKVTSVTVRQRLQMDALTLRLLRVEECVREGDLREGQYLGTQIGGILPNIEQISEDVLKEQLAQLDLKEVYAHGRGVLHANAECIKSLSFAELRYTKCVMTASSRETTTGSRDYYNPIIFGRRVSVRHDERRMQTVWTPFFLYDEKILESFLPSEETELERDLIVATEAVCAEVDALITRILDRQQYVYRDRDGHAEARAKYEKALFFVFDLARIEEKTLPHRNTDMGLLVNITVESIVQWHWCLADWLLDINRHGGAVISYNDWYGGVLHIRTMDERVRRLAAAVDAAVETHSIWLVRDYWKNCFATESRGMAEDHSLYDRLMDSLRPELLDIFVKEYRKKKSGA